MITNTQLKTALMDVFKNCTDVYIGHMSNAYLNFYIIVSGEIKKVHVSYIRYSDLKTKKDLIKILKNTRSAKYLKDE